MKGNRINNLLFTVRTQVAASHLILLEEIRTLQGRPFDRDAEANRLLELRNELLDQSGREALKRVLENRNKADNTPD